MKCFSVLSSCTCLLSAVIFIVSSAMRLTQPRLREAASGLTALSDRFFMNCSTTHSFIPNFMGTERILPKPRDRLRPVSHRTLQGLTNID